MVRMAAGQNHTKFCYVKISGAIESPIFMGLKLPICRCSFIKNTLMKKILFTLACITVVSMSYAQTVSGTKAIGGGINYTSESGLSSYEGGNDGKQTDFSIVPSFGYFVSDNFMLGVAIGYNSSKSEDVNFYDEETTG